MVEVMIESMREFQRAFGRAARDGQVIELDGVVASVAPGLGTHSLFNAALYERADDLRAALPELERRYDEAGVDAWGAWTHGSDTGAARALEEHGLVLDATPAAMARELAPGDFEPVGTVERTADMETFDRIEAAAWDFIPGAFADGMPGALSEFRVHLARDERGEPAAIVGTVHHRGDCGVTLVATAPQARGRGLATAAMRHALAEAIGDGCRTTTLQATAMGHPVYRRLGFRDFGAMHLWEKRRASAHP
jgi:GNAT superfamily N-acetyltransferase